MAPRNPYGIRKVITMTMTMVAAMVMRATTQVRPGYGVSSFFRNCQNHTPASSSELPETAAGSTWSWDDMLSTRPHDDDRRFAEAKPLPLRGLDFGAHR